MQTMPSLPPLRALGPGEAPQYPGLRRDSRGVIVGDYGLIAVRGAHRLATLLAALSHTLDLSQGITLDQQADELALLILNPAKANASPPQLYEAAQRALAASQLGAASARLYTGDGRIFVPYADPAAPHGYDVSGGRRPGSGAGISASEPLMLPSPPPTAASNPAAPTILSLLCAAQLLPAAAPPPITLAVLTDRRLAALVAGYVQRHGLAYGVRFLSWQRSGAQAEVALFDIVSAGEIRPLPRFVCDFLRRLPRTALFSDLLAPADLEHEPPRRLLVAWDSRPQFYPPHVQDLLPARGILLLGGAYWGSSLIETPPPRTTMQQVTIIEHSVPAQASPSARAPSQIQLSIALHPAGPAQGPIHALLLDAVAIARLQRMVRHLPAPFFAGARIALGDDVALLVAADAGGELIGLPLGLGLSRAEPPELLLPRGMLLLPALPQDLLVAALGLRPDTLTVLTATSRLDVSLATLQPLAGLLALGTPIRHEQIALRPAALPPLDLRGLDEPAPTLRRAPAAPAPPAPAPSEPEQRGLIQRLMGGKPAVGLPAGSFEQELRRRAGELEQRGDYELAAAFYTYLGDSKRAAACYRRLVERAG